ncbi:MAG: DUF2723 domain-containing protein [Chloroflexi bacterium]|nr:DUF2723 domain-containing protein [Chloroflexota bacterium]
MASPESNTPHTAPATVNAPESSRRAMANTSLDRAAALILGLLAFALYVRTLAPGLLGGDSGEFQMAAWLGGLAHPTGYPLYLMLGWLWSHLLPLGDPAYRMNLFSAFWAAVTVVLLYHLLVATGRRVLPSANRISPVAALVTLTFALTPTFWSQATQAEVYTLNAFFVVLLLLLCSGHVVRDRAVIAWCTFVFGLSLTHHRTMLLFLPALLAGLWLAGRAVWPGARRAAGLVTLLVLPQLLYLYIPLRAAYTPYLHLSLTPTRPLDLYENNLSGFLSMVSGSVFRGAIGTPVQGLGRVTLLAGFLNRQFTPVGILLGLLGLALLIRRRQWPLLALSGLGFLAIVGFGLIYFIGDVYDQLIPAYILWTIWAALGLLFLLDAAPARPAGGLFLLAMLLPAYLFLSGYPQQNRSHDRQARRRWQALLAQPVPRDALLVSNDRDEVVPLWYLQYVEGQRPDLLGLFPLITPRPEHSNVVRLLDDVLDTGRPIFLIKPMPGLEIKYRLRPDGQSLVRVVGPATGDGPLNVQERALNDQVTLYGWGWQPAAVRRGEPFTVTLVWEVQTPLETNYTSYIHLDSEDGQTIAQSDHRPGGVYYPSSLWQPGERLWDRHVLTPPATTNAGPYKLLVGLYDRQTMQRFGHELVIQGITLR